MKIIKLLPRKSYVFNTLIISIKSNPKIVNKLNYLIKDHVSPLYSK